MNPRFALLLLAACSASPPAPATPPHNMATDAPHEMLPCFSHDVELAEWHRLVRADHVLIFDVVSEDKPPPGWPDGWHAGSCRVFPKYNEATTNMDFLVERDGKTIASIGETHVDFYVRVPLQGLQPGDRVGARPFHDCNHEYNVWQFEGNRLCSDPSRSDRAYLVHTERLEPLPADTIVAVRASFPRTGGKR